ncbi:MAG: Omp28 family outer membrane lipoprotein, partial [Muribaculaceae bacterium]|nr:Omp28 family outer membrane lipoprotein [Muribaculaceae bacterium]
SSSLVSCDNIDADDRYIEVDAVKAERVVLIEDFTGQNCVNCPDAHAVIEGLEQQYGDHIVAVSIHGGKFAIGREKTQFEYDYIGLGTPEGEYFNSLYNFNSWPQGIINGRTTTDQFATWPTIVRAELERPAVLSIDLEATYDKGTNDINIDVELMPQEDIKGELVVWVLESGIVARQRSQSAGLIADYVHNNVFRAAVNGNDGTQVSLTKDIHQKSSFSIALRDNNEEKWNPENLSVVAFVKGSDGVYQTAKVPVL